MLKGKKLINFLEYLKNSFKAGLTLNNIIFNLKNAILFKDIALKIENDIINNKLLLSVALRKNNIVPDYVSYILEAGEKSGTILELINSLINILENIEKIKQETKIYRIYIIITLFLIFFGVFIFQFIFKNVFLIIVQDISNKNNFLIFVKNLANFLNITNVFIGFIIVLFISLLLSFRNIVLDIFEYYILGKPYRNLILSNVMIIMGNLIKSALSIPLAIHISTLTIENSILKEFIYKNFKNITKNFTEFNNHIANKLFMFFPIDYHSLLVNSFLTGTIDTELIEIGNKIQNESINSLKSRFFKILIFIIILTTLFLGTLIVISFLSIYLPFFQDIN
ncbi:MAG: type II secretion system F family protein [bacterium]